jgi:pyridoxamine 5'-phosphate oxidase family protein
MFSKPEIRYMKTQHIARIATVSPKGIPEVWPVGFECDGEYIYVGSHSQKIFGNTRRYRNIIAGNSRVSIVIDDMVSVDPWRPRGIRIQGEAEIVKRKGMFGEGRYFRITPRVSISWGIGTSKGGEWFSKTVHKGKGLQIG